MVGCLLKLARITGKVPLADSTLPVSAARTLRPLAGRNRCPNKRVLHLRS
jgi:hypothetical protein